MPAAISLQQPQLQSQSQPQPRPRPRRSPQETARIRVQNRRLEYLRRHPAYLSSSDREFANVKLYDQLVRRFQTAAERAAEAQDKGFGQVLEASILRNPEHLERAVEEADEGDDEEEEDEEDEEEKGEDEDEEGEKDDIDMPDRDVDPLPDLPDSDLPGLPDLPHLPDLDLADLPPRDAAARRWQAFVHDWFVHGGAQTDGFDYAAVDEDSDYDVLARADAEEAWFDDEEPGWGSDDGKPRTGETGVQDY